MRIIKFRGLRTDGKGWAYGNLLNEQTIGGVGENLSHYKYVTVIPETVGQYTGFIADKCKNNLEKEIYEGDIFRSEIEADDGDVIQYNVVVWVHQRGCFSMIPKDNYGEFINNDLSEDPDFSWLFEDANIYDFSIDVGLTKVGNIHENKDLI